MMKYLTQLLGKSVFDPDGSRVASVCDAIAHQNDHLPILTALFLKGKGREGWVPLTEVQLTEECCRLLRPWSEVPAYVPQDDDIRLQRDVLDKQIVDVQGYRVVRVNDVRLVVSGDRVGVVGVDAGVRALVRRTGLGWLAEFLARLIGRPLQPNLISWSDVETLEPGAAGGGRIKLKVPHETIARLHPADIADIVEQLDPQRRAEVIHALDIETAADTIEEMEDDKAASVIEQLEDEKAADILEEMEPDAAADLLGDLSEERSEHLLDHMAPEEAADVKELLAYGDETAGGLMTNEYIAVQATQTAEETIVLLRELAPKAETAYYVYVLDEEERLTGVISLRDLIVSDPSKSVGEFMVPNVRHVHTDENAVDVAHMISRYNLLALPVVDEDDRLVGIVTVDDMMELLLPPERRRRLPDVSVQDDE